MKKQIFAAVGAVALTLGLTACSATEDDKLTISLVPSTEGEDLAEALGPLTDYLSEQMGVEVEGVVASDYAATVEALGAGQSDAIITDAGSLYNAKEQCRTDPARCPVRRDQLFLRRIYQHAG